MFLAVSSERVLSPLKRTFGTLILICAVFTAQARVPGSVYAPPANQDLRLELPDNGNLRV